MYKMACDSNINLYVCTNKKYMYFYSQTEMQILKSIVQERHILISQLEQVSKILNQNQNRPMYKDTLLYTPPNPECCNILL